MNLYDFFGIFFFHKIRGDESEGGGDGAGERKHIQTLEYS